jgi:hypothetical protein
MNGQDLINQYLQSHGQRAIAKFGKVRVSICGGDLSSLPLIEINWPGIGDVDALTALAFSADLTAAAACALQAERIVGEWDGIDQWREPGTR